LRAGSHFKTFFARAVGVEHAGEGENFCAFPTEAFAHGFDSQLRRAQIQTRGECGIRQLRKRAGGQFSFRRESKRESCVANTESKKRRESRSCVVGFLRAAYGNFLRAQGFETRGGFFQFADVTGVQTRGGDIRDLLLHARIFLGEIFSFIGKREIGVRDHHVTRENEAVLHQIFRDALGVEFRGGHALGTLPQ